MTQLDTRQKILAVETCTMACSVAVWDGSTMHEQFIESERGHSQKILPMCQDILAQANMTMKDVDAIACTRGPGAFTGLRIGVGVAKGLAFGQDLPIYAVSSLQTVAYQAFQKYEINDVLVILDARMGELYVARYSNNDEYPELQGQEQLMSCKQLDIDNVLVAGTGIASYINELNARGANISDITFPTASDVIRLVQHQKMSADSPQSLTPVYIRNNVTY